MNKISLHQYLNLIAVLAVIVVNGLANALPFNNLTTGEISDQFQVFFVPAGYVFSIWGLIYLGLLLYAIYQIRPGMRDDQRLNRIGYIFIISCVANIAWLFFWHYELFSLTVVAMLILLLSLITIYLRLDIGRAQVSVAEKWSVDVPFSIYLGWISVATIANVTDLLDYLNWSGWGISPEAWAVILLVVGTGIAAAMSLTRGDVAFMLVIIWAFIGIAVKQSETPLVATAAWAMTVVTALVLVGGWVFARRSGSRPMPEASS